METMMEASCIVLYCCVTCPVPWTFYFCFKKKRKRFFFRKLWNVISFFLFFKKVNCAASAEIQCGNIWNEHCELFIYYYYFLIQKQSWKSENTNVGKSFLFFCPSPSSNPFVTIGANPRLGFSLWVCILIYPEAKRLADFAQKMIFFPMVWK